MSVDLLSLVILASGDRVVLEISRIELVEDVVEDVVVIVVVVVVLRVDVRLLRLIKSSDIVVIVVVVVLDVLLGWLSVQLVKMVLETSRGMMKMMRKEKYQAVSTANVTNTGCLIQLEYLHNKAAASIKAMQTSKAKTVYAMLQIAGQSLSFQLSASARHTFISFLKYL